MYSLRSAALVGVKNVSRRKWRIDREDISRRAWTSRLSCTRICNPECREMSIPSRRPTLALTPCYVDMCVEMCVWTWPREVLEISRRQREPRLHTIKTCVKCIMHGSSPLHEHREDRRPLSQIGYFPRRGSSRPVTPI